jgi:hypothetical protein
MPETSYITLTGKKEDTVLIVQCLFWWLYLYEIVNCDSIVINENNMKFAVANMKEYDIFKKMESLSWSIKQFLELAVQYIIGFPDLAVCRKVLSCLHMD